jgi:hypothetical protein
VVSKALELVGDEARKVAAGKVIVQQRITTVQAEVSNLVGVLARLGADALGSVQDRLRQLEDERHQLQGRLRTMESVAQPLTGVEEATRKFIEAWRSPTRWRAC